MKHFYNATKKTVFIGVISLLSISAFANDVKCGLNHICTIPASPHTLSYEVTPSIGTSYQCVIVPTKEKKKSVSVDIYAGGSFGFEKQKATADITGKGYEIVRFTGTFVPSNLSGEIRVSQVAGESADGVVLCSKYPISRG